MTALHIKYINNINIEYENSLMYTDDTFIYTASNITSRWRHGYVQTKQTTIVNTLLKTMVSDPQVLLGDIKK